MVIRKRELTKHQREGRAPSPYSRVRTLPSINKQYKERRPGAPPSTYKGRQEGAVADALDRGVDTLNRIAARQRRRATATNRDYFDTAERVAREYMPIRYSEKGNVQGFWKDAEYHKMLRENNIPSEEIPRVANLVRRRGKLPSVFELAVDDVERRTETIRHNFLQDKETLKLPSDEVDDLVKHSSESIYNLKSWKDMIKYSTPANNSLAISGLHKEIYKIYGDGLINENFRKGTVTDLKPLLKSMKASNALGQKDKVELEKRFTLAVAESVMKRNSLNDGLDLLKQNIAVEGYNSRAGKKRGQQDQASDQINRINDSLRQGDATFGEAIKALGGLPTTFGRQAIESERKTLINRRNTAHRILFGRSPLQGLTKQDVIPPVEPEAQEFADNLVAGIIRANGGNMDSEAAARAGRAILLQHMDTDLGGQDVDVAKVIMNARGTKLYRELFNPRNMARHYSTTKGHTDLRNKTMELWDEALGRDTSPSASNLRDGLKQLGLLPKPKKTPEKKRGRFTQKIEEGINFAGEKLGELKDKVSGSSSKKTDNKKDSKTKK